MKLSEIKDIATKIVKEMSGTGGGTAQGANVTGNGTGEQTFTPVKTKKNEIAAGVRFNTAGDYKIDGKEVLYKFIRGNKYIFQSILDGEIIEIEDKDLDRVKVVQEVKDVEPKLAAGKVKNNYYVTHFGYTPAPSVPNRKSKAMDYKQLFELQDSEYFIQIKNIKDVQNVQNIVVDDNLLRGKFKNRGSDVYITSDLEAAREFIDVLNQNGIRNVNNVEDYTDDLDEAAGTDEVVATLNNPNLEPDVKKMLFAAYRNKQITADGLIMIVDLILKKDIVNENYSQFRNKTSKREAPEQLHKAVKEIKKKLQEVDKLVKYTNRLRTEISEGEGEVKYSKHTPRALERIQEMIKHIYIEAKKLK